MSFQECNIDAGWGEFNFSVLSLDIPSVNSLTWSVTNISWILSEQKENVFLSYKRYIYSNMKNEIIIHESQR